MGYLRGSCGNQKMAMSTHVFTDINFRSAAAAVGASGRKLEEADGSLQPKSLQRSVNTSCKMPCCTLNCATRLSFAGCTEHTASLGPANGIPAI